MGKKIMLIILVICFTINVCYASTLVGASQSFTGTLTGASADITYKVSPYIHLQTESSSAWTMLQNIYAGKMYAQVGWIRYPQFQSSAVYFWQYNDKNGNYYSQLSKVGPALGTTHNYKVTVSNGTVYGYIDGYVANDYTGTPFSSTIDWTPTMTTFAGESSDEAEARYPGSIANHEYISSPKKCVNGTWGDVTGLQSTNQGYESRIDMSKYNSTNNYTIMIWDNRAN